MSDFVKEIHNMFDHIWDCEIDHPVYQDTVGELMEAVIQAREKHNLTLGTNLAEVGTDCISRQAAIDALKRAKQNIHHNIERAIGDAVCGILDEVENGIKQLPPANCSEIPNNSDTISRQAAIDAVQNRHMMLNKEKVLLINDLEKLPPAQPERARGTWMPDTMCYYEERFICSECKGDYKVDTCMGKPMWNFCPNCGAKMRGEQDG